MSQDNFNLDMSKIKTNVPGFDDLFFGGLRLPELKDGSGRDGICIVIYGNRGIGKTDLAMQIMRGVDNYLNENLQNGKKLYPKFRTLNHRESELRKKYVSLEVANTFSTILSPESVEKRINCNICTYFPKLKDAIKCINNAIPNGTTCCSQMMKDCFICKLIRHELINYSDNTQSLHWTFGDVSDSKNHIDTLDSNSIPTQEIFDSYEKNSDKYSSAAYTLFKNYQKEIYNAVHENERKTNDKNNQETDNKAKTNNFKWSSYVIEGFTAFGSDELERLPFSDLIINMRKTSAVSILVFDDRGKNLHLNADIIINMEYNIEEKSRYTYYQLQIIKSDLQQHVHGWHKYRKLRDLSVKIYPSMHSLLTKRFSSDNAVIKLEQRNLRYPQSLLDYFQRQCANNINGRSVDYRKVMIDIISDKNSRNNVYEEKNLPLNISLVSQEDYDDFIYKTVESSKKKDTTISFFLLGKTEQSLRRLLSRYELSQDDRRCMYYWESGLGCIWAEEFASIVKEYIQRWKKDTAHKKLHIIIDDFANINLFPLMEQERLLIPALVNICRNAITQKGFDVKNDDTRIQLSFVCTSDNEAHNIIEQFVKNY